MSCHVDDPDNNVPSQQSSNWFAFTGGGCCGSFLCRYRSDALVVLNFTAKCSNAFVNGNFDYGIENVQNGSHEDIILHLQIT